MSDEMVNLEAAEALLRERDTPPKTPRPKSAPTGRPKTRPPGAGPTPPAAPESKRSPGRPPKPKLADKLEEQFGAIGLLLYGVGAARGDVRFMYDGECVMGQSHRLAVALDRASLDTPAVRRLLEALVMASAWGEVAGAVAAIAIPILANHGVIPRDAAAVFGTEPPAPPMPDTPFAAPGMPEPNGQGL